jgi:hypothetical protein
MMTETPVTCQDEVCSVFVPKDNTRKTLSLVLTTVNSLIICMLSCVDRIVFKRYLHTSNRLALESFVDYVFRIEQYDFLAFAEQHCKFVGHHAKCAVLEARAE